MVIRHRCALATTALLLATAHVHAVPASPFPVQLTQPDGTPIVLYVRGSERQHWFEDPAGYTVVRVGDEYHYAALDSAGSLVSTGLRAGKSDPARAGLQRFLRPPEPAQGAVSLMQPERSYQDADGPQPLAASGTIKNLVVLCKFSDHILGVHTRAPADYDVLFNAVGGDATLAPTGSVRDCFDENSYGTMTLQSTVLAWVTLPQTQAYYGNGQDGTGAYPQNAQGMVRDALNLVDPLVDFGEFDGDNDGYIDSITFIHSGYGAETGGGAGNWIWSHRWSLWALPGGRWTSGDTNGLGTLVKVYDYHTEPALWGTSGTQICRIGVIVHETGHFFGLPDLYDTDGNSSGIGSWCMMANSWGFDGSQLHPPHFSAWCKMQLGWVTPIVINASGAYSAQQVEGSAVVYRINNGYAANEYLLIENRQPVGFESAMPQGGLAIWHIDDAKANNNSQGYPGQSGWPTNGNHYRVALLQADGQYQLEKNLNRGDAGDLYRSGGVSAISAATTPNTNGYQGGSIVTTNNVINSISAPGATMTFNVALGAAPVKAQITSPANGATLGGSTVTFQWDTGSGVTEYWLSVGTTAGGTEFYDASQGTGTSRSVSGLPANGSTVHARLWSRISGAWQYNDYSYTAATIASAKAAITSPAGGSTLDAATVTFQWNAGTNVTQYWLSVGTSAGGIQIYDGTQGTSTSKAVSGLPTNGSTVHVRLWSKINNAWQYNDYTYTAATVASGKAAITSPAGGSTLAGASVTFQWNTGTNVTQYWLSVGTSAGGIQIYDGTQGTSTSKAVSGLPTNGSTVHVRLWSKINNVWEYNDYTYTAATVASGKAAITSPAGGSTLAGASVTFQWNTGTNVTQYWLSVGTSAGGIQLYDGTQGTSTSKAVSGLPTNGSTVHVRLWSKINNVWEYNDYTYTAATVASGKAAMTSPAGGSTLAGASVTFQWNTGTNVTQYWLSIGTTAGGIQIYDATQGTNTSKTVSNLPTNGSTVHVRLWSKINNVWEYNDYTYTAATVVGVKAAITSPANGATFTGTTVTFHWNAGTAVTQYWLSIGTAGVNSLNIYDATQGTNLSKSVSGLPTGSRTVYVRLWSKINNVWQWNDYTYTSQ